MTSARPRIFFLSNLSLLFLLSSIAATAAEPRKDGLAGATPSRLAWALKPGVFETLSPGARQAVLLANSLAPAPARRVGVAEPRAGAAAAALAAPAPRQNVRVNNPALDVDHHASRTTSVAARGSRVFVGFEDATYTAAGYGVSNDGGATFAHMRIAEPDGVYNWGSPSVAIGPSGEIYYAFLQAANGDPTDIVLARSTDGGATFPDTSSPANGVANGFDVMDKPAVAVDNGASSPRKGWVYVAWTYYFSGLGYTAILCTHASDGTSFLPPAQLNVIDGAPVDHAAVAVAPNGDVYVAYQDGHHSPSGISITRSVDGGQTFGPLRTVATFRPAGHLTAGGGGAASNSGPSLAVDGNGVVHVVWAAVSAGSTTDRSDVFYARSTDNGATFSAARKLNDDATSTTQAFPSVAALSDGTVGVRWTDRRNDPARDTLTDAYMAISRDGGATWGKNFRLTDRNSPWAPAPYNLGGFGHTSHDSLAADGGTFYAAWTDERSGDADVWAAAVPEAFDALAPDFDLSALTTYAAAPQGGSATFDLAASGVNGFAGTLALAPDLAPAGLGLSLASTTATPGQTVRLTVAVPASTPPGDYVLGVAASAGGLVRGTRMRLTVRASGALPTPIDVTGSAGFATGTVKADAAGVLHAVANDDTSAVTGSNVVYRRSTDGGATFSAPLALNPNGSFANESTFTIDPAGRIFVVWQGRTLADTAPRVYFARSTDGGATFSAPAAVSAGGRIAELPNVAADANGNLVVAWYDLSDTAPVVEWSRSTNAGAAFSTQVPIFDAPSVLARPGLALDSKNDAFLAWTQQSSTSSVVRLAVSKAGAAFGAAATLSDAAFYAFSPDLAVGPDDSLALAYYTRAIVANVPQNRQVTFARSTNGGTSFSSAVFLSSAADNSYVPSVAFEPSGAIDVAWEEFDANVVQSDARVARSTDGGATFSPPANLSANGGLSGSAGDPVDGIGGPGRVSVSAGAGGALVVSWADDTGSALDLFFSMPAAALISNRPPVPVIQSPAPGAAVEAGVPVAFAGTATDPDGDPVTLTWDFGDGTGATGASPAAHAFAVPGAAHVTLTARDPKGATGTATLTVNVAAPAPAAGDVGLLVPVVLEASGVGGSHYRSELTLVARAGAPTDVILSYTASVGSGSGFARLTLAAGEMRVLPGVVDWLRGRGLPIPADGSSQVGTLLVTFRGVGTPGLVFAGARTFTPDPAGGGGTFGLAYPAAGSTTSSATLVGLQQSASQRSNVAVVNAGGSPIVVRVALRGPNGEDLGTLPDLALGPWGWFQYDQPFAGKATSGRAVVTRVSGTSPFTAYAVLNDGVTSDGSYVPPILGDDGSGANRLVPIVLDVAGLGARFRTELTLTNLTASPLPLTLAYTAAFGSGTGEVALTLAAGEQRIVPDAIAFLRGALPIENDGRDVGGSLLVRAAPGTSASALAVGARTYVPLSPSGSYGLFYSGLTAGACATGTAFVYGLEENASQRSNLAIVNRGDAGDTITLRVTFYGPDGAALGPPVERAVGPGGWFQFGRPFAALGASGGYAKVEKTSGASRFAAYGVLNDNVTSDGSYVAMSF